ncbi:hypothetical protein RND81_09G035200 [Saponaria officinalis]|uniref:Uncharacterized protein n=1 Tax=Saponaria officinalis TaxID=3572 RepID=A0AAW1IHJ3_SAPOF
MAASLLKAAKEGDVNFLREAASDYNFFVQCLKERVGKEDGNIFHTAAWNGKVDFFQEAMKLLSREHQKLFLFEKDSDGWTPTKGENGHAMVKLIIDFYKSLSTDDANGVGKPWLALSKRKRTALHIALLNGKENEKCAMEILSMDVELLSTTVDEHGNSPLFLAVKGGFNQVAEKILMSCPLSSSTVSGEEGSTALHVAPNCSEIVWRRLYRQA